MYKMRNMFRTVRRFELVEWMPFVLSALLICIVAFSFLHWDVATFVAIALAFVCVLFALHDALKRRIP